MGLTGESTRWGESPARTEQWEIAEISLKSSLIYFDAGIAERFDLVPVRTELVRVECGYQISSFIVRQGSGNCHRTIV